MTKSNSSESAQTAPAPKRLLDGIRSPADIKGLREQDLSQLAQEVRDELIKILSQTGGHLGPNLGVVELTIALHRVFNTPRDRFVMDVSHQGYVHKMFTGRLDRFHTMRQYGGLNGFLLRTESEHDCYGAGHAGTALSAALGMAVGRDLRGGNEHIVVVAGDAAFTCGISYEALNNVKAHTKRFIVVLNDNEWSIAKNVGAIANYLNTITTSPTFAHLHEKARHFVQAIAGKSVADFAHKVEESVKGLLVPSVIFEELGLRYYGPIDGHDIPLLIRTFEFLKTQEEPVLLHILTQKGKGYAPALKQPDKFHGLGKYKIESGETAPTPTPTYSEIFGKTLAKFAETNQKLVAITAAMPSGTGLSHFAKAHPSRYFDVGIAEEHATLFACGLATQGLQPFLAIYSTFFQRAYDMAIHDIAIQNLNVKLCMDRAGLSGDDGPTHHGLFDIGYLRHIPNWVHMQPKDEDEFVDMLWTMLHYNSGPIAIRYPRGSGPGVKIEREPRLLEIGKAEVVQHGRDVAIFGLGAMFEVAQEAARKLEEKGISVALINPRWIKPIDTGTLEFFARSLQVVCTIEDHVLHNGFGCAVMEHLHSQMINTPVVRIGWPDHFIEHGAVPILRKKYGITADALVEKVLPLLHKKSRLKPSVA
ncbi:MAG: 1-deoxy-D-xylulose-5-phosphate synthase [Verrucomicrobia bacterium]|nr:MAG: 1-deoxy-D-xylulose-5-phosphate synthase [Verrucomicrobiota bacterium]